MRISIVLLLLLPLYSFAEPNAAARYLMSEPATLFDLSMLRLQMLTDYRELQMVLNYEHDSKSGRVYGNVNAYYERNADKIYVVLSVTDEAASEAQMEAGCRHALEHIGIYVGKSTGEMFSHAGAAESSVSRELVSQFREMFEFRCYVSGRDFSEGRFWAHQSLTSEMKIGRWPVD